MTDKIKIYDVNGNLKYAALVEESSKRVFMLMSEDYIELVFKTAKKVAFVLGDYINLETYGRFEITTIQNPKFNPTTRVYEYTLRFNAPYLKWKNKKYKFIPATNRQETSFSLTERISTHMDVLVNNLAYHGWNFTWNYEGGGDDYVISSTKFIAFNDVSIYDALTKISEAYEVEWWVTDNIIHIGRVEIGYEGSPIVFEIGTNVDNISVNNSQGKSYFNVFIAFGSERNLPLNYRNIESGSISQGIVQKRLMLPKDTPLIYLDGINEASPEEQKVEGIVVFDDIFPRTNGKISSITSFEKDIEVKDQNGFDQPKSETVTFYRFTDDKLIFDSSYILENQKLQITFKTGELAGMTFDVVFNPVGVSKSDENYQVFEIVRNENYGVALPAKNYGPKVGDTYTLVGFDATKLTDLGLIEAAENELLERSKKYAKKLQIDPNNYSCTMLADYMYGLDSSGKLDKNFSKSFSLGDVILLKDQNLFEAGSRLSRVIGYQYRLDEPYSGAVITIGENATYSRSASLESDLNAKFQTISFGKNENSNTSIKNVGNNIYIITSNDDTAENDSNVYSSLRTKKEYANKRKDDTISALWTFLKGLSLGDGTQGYGFDANGEGVLDSLRLNSLRGETATFGNLNVTGAINVFEFIIQKVKSAGGAFVLSPADGFKVAKVEQEGDIYKLWWPGGESQSLWAVGDQAFCQTFNETGGNKLWWARVTERLHRVDEHETAWNGIAVSFSTGQCYEGGTGRPAVDDEVVMLGSTVEGRQGVVYISSYNTLDSDLQAPLIAFYVGVDDFDLASHRKSYFDARSARFVGSFAVEAEGGTQALDSYVGGLISRGQADLEKAVRDFGRGQADLEKTVSELTVTQDKISMQIGTVRREGNALRCSKTLKGSGVRNESRRRGSRLFPAPTLTEFGQGKFTTMRFRGNNNYFAFLNVVAQGGHYTLSWHSDGAGQVVFGGIVDDALVKGGDGTTLSVTMTEGGYYRLHLWFDGRKEGELHVSGFDGDFSVWGITLAPGTEEADWLPYVGEAEDNVMSFPLQGVNGTEVQDAYFNRVWEVTAGVEPTKIYGEEIPGEKWVENSPVTVWVVMKVLEGAGEIAFSRTDGVSWPADSYTDEDLGGGWVRRWWTAYNGNEIPVLHTEDGYCRLTLTNSRILLYAVGMVRGEEVPQWLAMKNDVVAKLKNTGIDVERGRVRVTANRFEVLNNFGENTLVVDEEGKLLAGGLIVLGKDNRYTKVTGGTHEIGLWSGTKENPVFKKSIDYAVDTEGNVVQRYFTQQGELMWVLDGSAFVNKTGTDTWVHIGKLFKLPAMTEDKIPWRDRDETVYYGTEPSDMIYWEETKEPVDEGSEETDPRILYRYPFSWLVNLKQDGDYQRSAKDYFEFTCGKYQSGTAVLYNHTKSQVPPYYDKMIYDRMQNDDNYLNSAMYRIQDGAYTDLGSSKLLRYETDDGEHVYAVWMYTVRYFLNGKPFGADYPKIRSIVYHKKPSDPDVMQGGNEELID